MYSSSIVTRAVILAGLVMAFFPQRTEAQFSDDVPCRCRYSGSPSLAMVAQNADDSNPALDSTYKSPSKALERSLYGTLVPLPTLFATIPGIVVGPALGYFYAGLPRRAWTGIGLRTVGLGGMVSAFFICGWDCGPGDDSYTPAWIVFLSGSALMASSAIYDIATVKAATRERNERHRSGATLSFGFQYFSRIDTPGFGMHLRL